MAASIAGGLVSGGLIALFLWSAVFASLSVNAADPCSVIGPSLAAGGLVSLLSAKECLSTFSYDPVRANAIITTLINTYSMHVYKDISKDSPTPEFPMKVDVIKGLKEIGDTVYENDFAFNIAIYELINSLNDGHAVYAPYCYYGYLVTYTAFPLVSVYENGQQIIKITPELEFFESEITVATEEVMGTDILPYTDATVLTINGVDALTYAMEAAEKAGVYKDVNARFNTLFSRYAGVSSLYYGGLCAMPFIASPDADNVTFVVRRAGSTTNETLIVPYLVAFLGTTFSSGADYWENYCVQPSPLSAAETTKEASQLSGMSKISKTSKTSQASESKEKKATMKRHVMAKMPHKEWVHKKFDGKKTKKAEGEKIDTGKETKETRKNGGPKLQQYGDSLSSSQTDGTVSILVDSYVSTYLLGDGVTGVMVVPDFEGDDADYSSWQVDIYAGVTSLLSSGGTQLIIDVQDNGGGYAYLSYVFLEFLFPGVVFPQYPIQNPASPLVTKLVEKSNSLMESTKYWLSNPSQYNWAFDTYPYPDNTMFTSSSEFFFPIVNLTFGNTTSPYSALYSFPDRLPSPLGIDELLLPAADNSPLFDPSKILILSNGGCYSTCSLFAYLAQEIVDVKIVAVGGLNGSPMAYSAGSAGYSYTLDYFLDYDLEYLGFQSDVDAPKPLPIQAAVGYTGAQAYCRANSSFPADFVFKAANHRIQFTNDNVYSILSLWYQAATFF